MTKLTSVILIMAIVGCNGQNPDGAVRKSSVGAEAVFIPQGKPQDKPQSQADAKPVDAAEFAQDQRTQVIYDKMTKTMGELQDLERRLPPLDSDVSAIAEHVEALDRIATQIESDFTSLQAIAAEYALKSTGQGTKLSLGLALNGAAEGGGAPRAQSVASNVFRIASTVLSWLGNFLKCLLAPPVLQNPNTKPAGFNPIQLIAEAIRNLIALLDAILNSCIFGRPPVSDVKAADTVVSVPLSGPYGSQTFKVYAGGYWVNSGLFLKKGQTAKISAKGRWQYDNQNIDASGLGLGSERGCRLGSLVARSGLNYNKEIQCIGVSGTFTAAKDETLYVGMNHGDGGEMYGNRLGLKGVLDVTVTSDGGTVPSLSPQDAATVDLTKIASGNLEIIGRHILLPVTTAAVLRDRSTLVASVETLDRIYEAHLKLRGMAPFDGVKIRFFPDPEVVKFGYMIAGNPIRTLPDLFEGGDFQRILRASVINTDIWGFAHEIGHNFTAANGVHSYMRLSYESWPNVFTLHSLEMLNRVEGQPNARTYCDGKNAYLASGEYSQLKSDPFLQLCFLMEFQKTYGWEFWQKFNAKLNGEYENSVAQRVGGSDQAVWTYVRDLVNQAAGSDQTAVFKTWRLPVN